MCRYHTVFDRWQPATETFKEVFLHVEVIADHYRLSCMKWPTLEWSWTLKKCIYILNGLCKLKILSFSNLASNCAFPLWVLTYSYCNPLFASLSSGDLSTTRCSCLSWQRHMKAKPRIPRSSATKERNVCTSIANHNMFFSVCHILAPEGTSSSSGATQGTHSFLFTCKGQPIRHFLSFSQP